MQKTPLAHEIAGLLRELNVDGYLDESALVEATDRFSDYLQDRLPDFDRSRFHFIAVES